MAMSSQDKNTIIAKAVRHPIRRKILRALAEDTNAGGGVSPSKLAEQLEEPLGNISYHMRLLFEDGILRLVKTEPRRGAVEHFYRRSGNTVDKKVATFLEMLGKD